MSENNTLSYIHKDHLMGTSLVTSDNGTVVQSLKYYSYGLTRELTGPEVTDKLFTGQRLDGTGLYFYGARYYDPLIGRFISPDSIVPDPASPQSFNRYAYCLNNPLKYTDPSGHYPENDPWDPYYELIKEYQERMTPKEPSLTLIEIPVTTVTAYTNYNFSPEFEESYSYWSLLGVLNYYLVPPEKVLSSRA